MSRQFDVPKAISNFDDVASWIKSPPPDRPLAGAVGLAGQGFCDTWSSAPEWFRFALDESGGFTAIGKAAADLICKPYLEDNGYSPPSELPPYLGGQCVAGYSFTVQENVSVGPQPSPRNVVVGAGGPITSASVVDIGGGNWRIQGVGRFGFFASSTVPKLPNWTSGTIIQAFRSDGMPDNCGNLPGEYGPGANPAPAPSDPGVGNRPGFNPSGQPFFFIPDVPGGGGEDYPFPTDPFGGTDGGDGGGGTGVPGGPAAGEEQDGEGSGEGGGETEFPEPEEGRRWAGVEVNLTTVPVGTGIVPPTIPLTVFTEIVGNARLRLDDNTGVGYDSPVPIKSKSFRLWEPIRGAPITGVLVNLKPGFEYTVTPLSVPLED